MRKKPLFIAIGLMAVVGIAVGLYLFQPWKAFTSSEVHEAPPAVAEQAPEPDAEQAGDEAAERKPLPKQLAEGKFVSQEHETSGTAQLIRRVDGRIVLRFEKLAGSDGPDLHVWLTDRKAGLDDWGAYDDGRYVALGGLKATHGEQNYLLPAGTKVDGLRSAVIWCDRFNVAFGSAPLSL